MHVVFTNYSSNNTDFKRLTGLPDKLSYSFRQLTCQHLIPIFRNPNKVMLYLVNRMTAVPIIHADFPRFWHSITAKADWLKPVI